MHGQYILINHLYIFIEDYVYCKICGKNSQSNLLKDLADICIFKVPYFCIVLLLH